LSFVACEQCLFGKAIFQIILVERKDLLTDELLSKIRNTPADEASSQHSHIEHLKRMEFAKDLWAVFERMHRSCSDPCDKHLGQIVTEYTAYFNEERPQQGIDQRIPDYYEAPKSKALIPS
jgi:hypothetical protein